MKMDLYMDAALSQKIQIEVPTHRNCPTCRSLIEHNQGCKHISCLFCKTSFCWVCMGVQKGAWMCGAYNNYCGFIAPNPNF
jgi:LSD1 subclass zinc finger protein